MPSNEERRAAAKQKLEHQLADRADRARKRKRLTIAGSALGVVVVVAAVTGVYFLTRSDDSADSAQPNAQLAAQAPEAKAKAATVNCTYRDGQKPADKPVDKPKGDAIPTTGKNAEVSASMVTNQGPLGLTLNNAESPCTVNSFLSLSSKKFYDNTECHRMTADDGLKVLQCGDPTGSGAGGPGYEFDNEYPTDQYAPEDPKAQEPITYERGTLAMANAGPGTNGSQFFLVYGDSKLPPQYTIFGKIDDNSLPTLDKIAELGQDNANGPGDGKPNQPVSIQSVDID
ncbi:peptidylprolyl isomerase [Nocardia callitridis]|uniref:Peptidyl-prolyl cis-trans isomerase n=1 Tax=Nocardia callitridis TaxID=648753 RepID=A0ABP9KBN7_9NOCA